MEDSQAPLARRDELGVIIANGGAIGHHLRLAEAVCAVANGDRRAAYCEAVGDA